MRRSNFAAWVLILLGVFILLHQLNIVYLTRTNIIIFGSILLGVLLFKKGLSHPTHKGILGGSFFILLGISLLLMRIDFFPIEDSVGIGLIFISLGLANIIYFFFTRSSFSNLVLGIIFAIIGAPFLIIYYDLMPLWMIGDLFSTYWPVLLILIGGGLLIEGLIKKSKSSDTDLTQSLN